MRPETHVFNSRKILMKQGELKLEKLPERELRTGWPDLEGKPKHRNKRKTDLLPRLYRKQSLILATSQIQSLSFKKLRK